MTSRVTVVVGIVLGLLLGSAVVLFALAEDDEAEPGDTRAGVAASPDVRRDARAGSTASPDGDPALAVLNAWHRRRAQAFARGDPDAMRALYVDARVATADLRLLARYRRQGVRITGVAHQVLAFRAVRRSERLLVVQVTARLAGGELVGRGFRLPLPRDRPEQRMLTLERAGTRWQVAEVRAVSTRVAGEQAGPG